jgi:hypothetical protein
MREQYDLSPGTFNDINGSDDVLKGDFTFTLYINGPVRRPPGEFGSKHCARIVPSYQPRTDIQVGIRDSPREQSNQHGLETRTGYGRDLRPYQANSKTMRLGVGCQTENDQHEKHE